MSTFLQILGAIFLLIIAYIAFRVLWLVGKVVLIVYGIKKFVAEAQGPAPAPTIRLVPVVGAKWDDAEAEAKALAAGLLGLGYEVAGFFDLDALGGIRLQAWAHTALGLYAVVYSSPRIGAWSDVVSKYEDGTSLTYSNSPHGGKLKQRPGRENVYFEGVGAVELHRKMLVERPDRPTRRLTTGDFVADFERAYAEEMEWRASPEGFDPATITPGAALAGMIGGKFTPDQMRQIQESMLRNLYETVAQRLRQEYRAIAAPTDDEWARIGPRLVFVWDTMNVESLRVILAEWDGLPEIERLDNSLDIEPLDDGLEAIEGDGEEEWSSHVRQSFAALNAGVPANRRLHKLGEVAMGLYEGDAQLADVYERPDAPVVRGLEATMPD